METTFVVIGLVQTGRTVYQYYQYYQSVRTAQSWFAPVWTCLSALTTKQSSPQLLRLPAPTRPPSPRTSYRPSQIALETDWEMVVKEKSELLHGTCDKSDRNKWKSHPIVEVRTQLLNKQDSETSWEWVMIT